MVPGQAALVSRGSVSAPNLSSAFACSRVTRFAVWQSI